MATDDAMDVEASQGPTYGMDVEGVVMPLGPVPAAASDSIRDARNVVATFLRDHRAEDIVPVNSRVVVIDSAVRLRQAFKALLENGIRAAPVVDAAKHKFVGILTVSDFIDCLIHFHYSLPDRDLSRGLSEHSVASWKAVGKSPGPIREEFPHVDAEDTLLEACRKLRDYRIHRLPILYKDTLLCTLDNWRVLQFLHQHLAGHDRGNDPHTAGLFNLTLAQLDIGTYSNMVTVRETDSLLHILEVLRERNLSAVPVVDGSGILCNVYSRTDISVLAKENNVPLSLEQRVSQTLASFRTLDFAVATCRQSDTLGVIFQRFERSRKHRLYAVSENGVVNGVVSLSDLLQYFLEGF